jgi:aquaporin PIP
MSNSKRQPNVERNMEEGLPVDWVQPEPAPLVDRSELLRPSLYRAIIAEFVATLLFVYVGLLALMGVDKADESSGGGGAAAGNTVGLLGVAWAFGGAIFIMVYCISGISGSAYLCKISVVVC